MKTFLITITAKDKDSWVGKKIIVRAKTETIARDTVYEEYDSVAIVDCKDLNIDNIITVWGK